MGGVVGLEKEPFEDFSDSNMALEDMFEDEEFTSVALVSGLRRNINGGLGGGRDIILDFSFVILYPSCPVNVVTSGDMLGFEYQSFCSSSPTLQLPLFQSGISSSSPKWSNLRFLRRPHG